MLLSNMEDADKSCCIVSNSPKTEKFKPLGY